MVQTDPIKGKIREMEVIDTDFHLAPDFSQIHKYLKEPFHTKIQSYPLSGAEYDARYAIAMEDSGLSVQGKATSGEEVLSVIDKIGVDTVILSPGLRPINYFNEPISGAMAAGYNDFLIHEVFPLSTRLKGYLMVNQRDPAAAASEIRRVGDNHSFLGVYAEFGAHEPIGTSRHDPIFDALAEYELPLALHGSGFWQQRSPLSTGARTWVENIGIAWPSFAMACVGSMIMQGLFDKYPNQQVLLQEAGLWWVIEFMLRMDEFYLDHPHDIQLVERKLESGEKFLNKLPSEYVLEHIRFATQPIYKPKSPKHFAWLLEISHAEKLFVYSSDWPHATFDPANWVLESSAISETLSKRILSSNAKELFKRL